MSEKLKISSETIVQLATDENLTPGVRQSLTDLALELKRVEFCGGLGVKVRLNRARRLCGGLITSQYQSNPELISILDSIGVSGHPKRNPKD